MKEDYEKAIDLIEYFIAFESDNELFKYKVKNVVFWDYIRYNIFNDLIHKSFRERKTINNKFNKIFMYLSQVPAYGILRTKRFVSGNNEYDDRDILAAVACQD